MEAHSQLWLVCVCKQQKAERQTERAGRKRARAHLLIISLSLARARSLCCFVSASASYKSCLSQCLLCTQSFEFERAARMASVRFESAPLSSSSSSSSSGARQLLLTQMVAGHILNLSQASVQPTATHTHSSDDLRAPKKPPNRKASIKSARTQAGARNASAVCVCAHLDQSQQQQPDR